MRTKKVNMSCGHTVDYDSFVPDPGDEITCLRCDTPVTVVSVDSRQLGISCPECNRIIGKTALRAELSASVVMAKHNVKNQHHATVITIGQIDEQPCLIPNPAQPDAH